MGQELSCVASHENDFFRAVKVGNLETVEAMLERDPTLIEHTTVYGRLSPLHIAAANGRIELLNMNLDRSIDPDLLNRHKQTPLMLAAKHGRITCVEKLIGAGANILKFDSVRARTCLHYAAYYGHLDCLKAIIAAAQSSSVADSWGFARFMNVRDGKGATPLHLAARKRRPECVHVLLENGALVNAATGTYGFPESSPLHLAARGGSLDCVRELLAWGADRLQRDSSGRIPYTVALKHKHSACAALLNPSAAEPLVWPSPLKFISELGPDAKVLLEKALMVANREREKNILKGIAHSPPSPLSSDCGVDDNASEASESDLCCICFDQVCSIEVQDCGHQMCAHCTLALCCHNKPNSSTTLPPIPVCPFCRSTIAKLVVAKTESEKETERENYPSKARKARRSRNFSEGSSSFKSLSAIGSFSKMGGRGSGRIASGSDDYMEKP
ncbi:hypothetical protein Sjap_012282 [Stephania japonica]|uniref:RING-type E3 ubiquitin transferase n=1 Tax=Stephania japonica TaxID=461633 RepID=A0AAP0NYR5_9MAGN